MSKLGDALVFEQQVGDTLRGSGFQVKQNVAVGGLAPDFVAITPHGGTIVIESKAWKPSQRNLARAAAQVKLYKAATRSEAAYIVIKDLQKSRPKEGLLAISDLSEVLSKSVTVGKEGAGVMPQVTPVQRIVFAAMPFAAAYDDVFFVAMTYAAESNKAVCKRVDHDEFSGDIVERIKALIRSSIAVIADLSESKPNVLYETGFAHALDLPTVHVCSTEHSSLPFDVRNWNTISYVKGQTFQLRQPLSERLRALLSGGPA